MDRHDENCRLAPLRKRQGVVLNGVAELVLGGTPGRARLPPRREAAFSLSAFRLSRSFALPSVYVRCSSAVGAKHLQGIKRTI